MGELSGAALWGAFRVAASEAPQLLWTAGDVNILTTLPKLHSDPQNKSRKRKSEEMPWDPSLRGFGQSVGCGVYSRAELQRSCLGRAEAKASEAQVCISLGQKVHNIANFINHVEHICAPPEPPQLFTEGNTCNLLLLLLHSLSLC